MIPEKTVSPYPEYARMIVFTEDLPRSELSRSDLFATFRPILRQLASLELHSGATKRA